MGEYDEFSGIVNSSIDARDGVYNANNVDIFKAINFLTRLKEQCEYQIDKKGNIVLI